MLEQWQLDKIRQEAIDYGIPEIYALQINNPLQLQSIKFLSDIGLSGPQLGLAFTVNAPVEMRALRILLFNNQNLARAYNISEDYLDDRGHLKVPVKLSFSTGIEDIDVATTIADNYNQFRKTAINSKYNETPESTEILTRMDTGSELLEYLIYQMAHRYGYADQIDPLQTIGKIDAIVGSGLDNFALLAGGPHLTLQISKCFYIKNYDVESIPQDNMDACFEKFSYLYLEQFPPAEPEPEVIVEPEPEETLIDLEPVVDLLF